MRKIVVISSYDATSPVPYSGVPYYFVSALRECFDVALYAAIEPQVTDISKQKAVHYWALGLQYEPDRDPDVIFARAEKANEFLKINSDAEAVVVFHPPDAAYLNTRLPVVIVHDATWGQFADVYPGYDTRKLAPESYDAGFVLEKKAFDQARWIIFFTRWAMLEAAGAYPDKREKMIVAPAGACWLHVPSREEIMTRRTAPLKEPVRLLFVGAAAHRKGLDIALKTQGELQNLGCACQLDVVGASPLALGDDYGVYNCNSNIKCHGYLRKDDRNWQLNELFFSANFLLVPSRADCGSLAICDAAAFGLPSISSGAGGIASLMSDWKVGSVVGENADPSDYAREIKRLIDSQKSYVSLCRGARASYESGLNWSRHILSLQDVLSRSSEHRVHG